MFKSVLSNVSLATFGFLVMVVGLFCGVVGDKMLVGILFVVPGAWCIWGAFDNLRHRTDRASARPTIGDRLALPHLVFLASSFGAWVVTSLAGFERISSFFGMAWAGLFLALPITVIVSIIGLWKHGKQGSQSASAAPASSPR